MEKRVKKSLIFGISFGQIFLLISMIFAFAFLVSLEIKPVDAAAVAGYLSNGVWTPASNGALTLNTQTLAVTDSSGTVLGTVGKAGEFTASTANGASQVASGAGTGSSGGASNFVSNIFSGNTFTSGGSSAVSGLGNIAGNLVAGVAWGAVVGGIAYFIGGLFGVSDNNKNALFMGGVIGGVAGGIARFVAQNALSGSSTSAVSSLTPAAQSTANMWGFGIGLAVMALVVILMWEDVETQVVTFKCYPWEAPLGGANCDQCNKDPLKPCSEYRCKSLGQACDIVNKGTDKEQCVWVSKFDVTSPTITPWTEPLNKGLTYSPITGRPMERGTKIVNSSNENGCLEPFTPLKFGFKTNEPAQCKLDYVPGNYSNLKYFFGESNYYELNHTQRMALPALNYSSASSTSPLLKNDGTMQLWVQCQDANGNRNEDTYLIEFCVDPSPDTTAPVINGFSINTDSPVRYKVDNLSIEAYTNEPAQCKWSRQDKTLDNMENSMKCATSAIEMNGNMQYVCTSNLSGIKDRENNDYYFRCIDNAGNRNMESKKLTLKGSQPLVITSALPNETQFGSTTTVPVTLEVTTDSGANEGKSVCYYSGALTSGFNEMLETDSFKSTQPLNLLSGNYTYQIKCVDAGGNVANTNVSFQVFVDSNAPFVTRTYKDQALKIVTNEDAECTYSLQSCLFELTSGIKMEYANVNVKNQLYAPWQSGVKYYIRCVDKYGNQPVPGECSVIVSPRPLGIESSSSSETIGIIGGNSGIFTTNSTSVSSTSGNGTIGTSS